MKYFVLKYIVPFLLIQSSILKINCQMNRPKVRRWHTAAFVDDKYYIFGGITETGQQLREFLDRFRQPQQFIFHIYMYICMHICMLYMNVW